MQKGRMQEKLESAPQELLLLSRCPASTGTRRPPPLFIPNFTVNSISLRTFGVQRNGSNH